MSVSNFKIQIDVCLSHPIEANNIWLRHIRYLPFVPSEGQVIRFTDDADENTLDVTLENVVYDCAAGGWLASTEDGSMVDSYNACGTTHETDAVATYKPFGFIRLNYPTAQAVR